MPADLQRIADTQPSVSGKIRALDRAGVPRAEIARFLNKRYQHVRNVLEADIAKSRGGPALPPGPPVAAKLEVRRAAMAPQPQPGGAAIVRLSVADDGTLALPPRLLAAFGSGPGEVVIGMARPGEITLRTAAASIGRAQELVRALIPGDDSLADSLLLDRHREAEEELSGG